MIFNQTALNTAIAQTLGNLVALADEKSGSRAYSAIVKAMTEIRENNSIYFDREKRVLTFVSRYSAKQRKVTDFGCYETCGCGNQFSYHQSVFEILSRYYELEDAAKKVEVIYLAGNRPKAILVGQIRIN